MQIYMFYTIQPNLASKKKHMVNDLKQKGDNTYKKKYFPYFSYILHFQG